MAAAIDVIEHRGTAVQQLGLKTSCNIVPVIFTKLCFFGVFGKANAGSVPNNSSFCCAAISK